MDRGPLELSGLTEADAGNGASLAAASEHPVVDEAYLIQLHETALRTLRRVDAMEVAEEVIVGRPNEAIDDALPISPEVLAILAAASEEQQQAPVTADTTDTSVTTTTAVEHRGAQEAFVAPAPGDLVISVAAPDQPPPVVLVSSTRLDAEEGLVPLAEGPLASPRLDSRDSAFRTDGAAWAPTSEVVRCPISFNPDTLKQFLLDCSDISGIADVLIQTGDYVWGKIHNRQTRLTTRRLESEEVEFITSNTYGLSAIAKINNGEPLDYRAEKNRTIDDTVSFRANGTRCRVGDVSDGISLTLRYVTDVPMPFETLGLEQEIVDEMFVQYGLVLIVGTTGSGKSTILASSVRERLQNRPWDPVKIGTYENPIEYTFQTMGLGVMPLVTQVEIGEGRHLNKFAQVGPNAMRRGGDVYIVGEMRDRESVDAAFELAMTGHAVYATLHVERPAQVIDRIVSFFPEDAQPAAASKLRSVLTLVVAQKQFRNSLGKSERVRSWTVFDRAVNERLSELKWHQWEREINSICVERHTDFDSRVLSVLRAGRLTFEQFKQVTRLTKAEAIAYCAKEGIDVRALG